MLGLTQSFIKYSKQLYSSPQTLESLRSFRMLYESFSNCSTLLNGYTALTEDFAETQKRYVEEQVSLFTKIVFKEQKDPQGEGESSSEEVRVLTEQNLELKEVLRRYEEELSKYTGRNSQQEEGEGEFRKGNNRNEMDLIKKIEELEGIIAENNDEFAIEVQRYNRLLYEEREEFNRL